MEKRAPQKASAPKKTTGKTKKKKNGIKIAIIILIALLLTGMAAAFFLNAYIKPPAIPTNAEIPEERADGVYNVLVVGTDKVGLNTDTIMVLSLDTKNDQANVMSIPRDTMSNVTRKVKKINAAYSVGGKANIDQLKEEVKYLLGFEVDYYVVVNLQAFEQIIDAIGGVTIDVKRNMDYEDPYQNLSIHIKKGEQTLNGKDAIGFVRYRHGYAEGDLGRVKAQQQFMEALAKQMATPATVSKLPKLANIVLNNMETDLTVGEMVWMGQQALEIDMSTNLHMFILPGEARYVNGLSYYLPDETEILEVVNAHFNPYPTPIRRINVVDVASLPKSEGTATQKEDPKDEPASLVDDEEADENEDQNGEAVIPVEPGNAVSGEGTNVDSGSSGAQDNGTLNGGEKNQGSQNNGTQNGQSGVWPGDHEDNQQNHNDTSSIPQEPGQLDPTVTDPAAPPEELPGTENNEQGTLTPPQEITPPAPVTEQPGTPVVTAPENNIIE